MSAVPVPAMTDPLGKYWDQPSPDEIVFDDTHALMNLRTFHELPEYSTTVPTGTYAGKMWRRAIFDPSYKITCWLLCWYSDLSDNNKLIAINSRRILIADGELPL